MKFSILNIIELKEVNNLQKLFFYEFDKLFINKSILNLEVEYNHNIGVRGKFINELNLLICVSFYLHNYKIELFLYFDQLEYYIYKNSKIVFQCNLEDFTENENEIVSVFIKYFKKDLDKLNLLL